MTEPTVAAFLAKEISAQVALARLVLAGKTPDEIEPLLPAGSELALLFAAQRGNLQALADMLNESGTTHVTEATQSSDESVAAIAAMFDRAVALSPAASVAAYSLGDDALLAATTQELIDWLFLEDLAPPHVDALDIGCGIGRVAGALAPHVRSVLGLDVSAGMIDEARRRFDLPNLRFAQTDGRPLHDHPSSRVDLVLFVDSMPYLVQAGIAHEHICATSRLLRPGGALVILNLSYRGNEALDDADARVWAADNKLVLTQCGERPFRLWDATAYVMRAPGD